MIRLFLSILFIISLLPTTLFAQVNKTVNNDSSKTVIIKKIILSGNDKSKDHIIFRELIFHIDDTISRKVFKAAAIRTRENLLNTFLFNFVEIKHVTDVNNHTIVTIEFTERWYLWPIPIFELVDRNFNEWWQTRDFSRTNFGINLTQQNFRGRNESVRLVVRFGYDQNYGLIYSIPYLNKKQNDGLRFGFNFFQSKETAYKVVDNKLQFINTEEDFVIQQVYSGIRYSHRIGHNKMLAIGLEYHNTKVKDTLVASNNEFLSTNSNQQEISELTLQYQIDSRDSKSYPLSGNEFRISAVKQGFGLLKNEPNNAYVSIILKHYIKFNERFNLSGSLSGKLSDGKKLPYYNTRALGYGNIFVRGYELYVVNGQNYSLLKTNFKYTLSKPRAYSLNWIPSKKFNKIPVAFYLNLFADFGYVKDKYFAEGNSLANKLHGGYGAGIDFVTYYDLVTRFEYSFNKFGENAFFIHFRAPI